MKTTDTFSLDSDFSITYCNNTRTIRQLPNNCLLATNQTHGVRCEFIMTPDLNCNIDLVLCATKVLMEHQYKWTATKKEQLNTVKAIADEFKSSKTKAMNLTTQYLRARLCLVSRTAFESVQETVRGENTIFINSADNELIIDLNHLKSVDVERAELVKSIIIEGSEIPLIEDVIKQDHCLLLHC
ncbi:hypothetical protein AB6E94_19170 [Vibrio lentus]|uniref:hypothetical protein n=1 Tax=Vibrio TaxID=662 RepID=UPI000C8680CE|nr:MULTISPECIES: hypothetical protein [Vibrio]MCC4838084.1 hypothetical protein [Vibrio lentus]PMG17824.1 hypothetical protein BCU98_00395 [Vibrio splendidus]